MKKTAITLLVFVLLATMLTGCATQSETKELVSNEAKSETTEAEEALKTITLGESFNFLGGFGTFYDPSSNARSYSYHYYINNFYDTLVEYRNGKIAPSLAKSWKISEDGMTYTFHLREDVKFSNGTEFNAESVKFYYDNMKAIFGDSNNNGMLESKLKEIVVTGEHEVEFHMSSPYFGVLNDLAMVMPRGIVAPAAFNQDGSVNYELLSSKTLGTGPYMYEGENKEDTEYTFVRNTYYYGEKPEADVFVVKIIPDADTKMLALRNKEIDIIMGADKLSYETFNEMRNQDGFTGKVSDINFVTEYMAINTTMKPFDDLNVRKAINHAIDKEAIVKKLYHGLKTKADTIMSTDLPYCDIDINPYEYNIEKSKSLLDNAGWVDNDGDGVREKDGKKLSTELKYISNGVYDKLVLVLQESLQDIGMEITLKTVDISTFFTEVYGGEDYQLATYISYWIPYDPYLFVANMNPSRDYSAGAGKFSTDPMVSRALANKSYEEAYNLISGLVDLTDENEIRDVFHETLICAHESAVLVPIDYMNELTLYNNTVIKEYEFNSIPNLVDISGLTLK